MSFSLWPMDGKLNKAVFALVAIVFTLGCGPTPVEAQESPSAQEASRSCLWEVSSEKATLFLLGTVHLLKPGTHTVSPAAEAAFQQAQTILLEVDLDEAESPEAGKLFSRMALLRDETIEDKISSDTLALLVEKTEAMGLPFDRLRSFKPWFLSLTLTLIKLQTLGFDPKHGIDRYFFDKAKQADKEIRALETVEYQLDRFAGLPDRIQEQLLLQTLQELDDLEEEMEQMVEAWSRGEVEVLEELTQESFKEFPGLYQRLIVERNKNWSLKIEPILNRPGTTMVVVGALHLVGSESIVELLEKQGYTVKQL